MLERNENSKGTSSNLLSLLGVANKDLSAASQMSLMRVRLSLWCRLHGSSQFWKDWFVRSIKVQSGANILPPICTSIRIIFGNKAFLVLSFLIIPTGPIISQVNLCHVPVITFSLHSCILTIVFIVFFSCPSSESSRQLQANGEWQVGVWHWTSLASGSYQAWGS